MYKKLQVSNRYEVNMFSKISNGQAKKIDNGISSKIPLDAVNEISRSMPGIWKEIEEKYWEVRDRNISWHSFYFLADFDWFLVFSKFPSTRVWMCADPANMYMGLCKSIALCTWRYNQSIYTFDADFAEMFIESLPKKIPMDAFKKLPELSLYINMPNLIIDGVSVDGFWVTQIQSKYGELFLSILLLSNDGLKERVQIISPSGSINLSDYPTHVQHMLSAIYYLCSEQPEINNVSNSRKRPNRYIDVTSTRHGDRLFPPAKPTYWLIGAETGEKVRHYRMNGAGKRSTNFNGRRSHVRRAHWNHYWHGPRDSKHRELVAQWLPAQFVNEVIYKEPRFADNYEDAMLAA